MPGTWDLFQEDTRGPLLRTLIEACSRSRKKKTVVMMAFTVRDKGREVGWATGAFGENFWMRRLRGGGDDNDDDDDDDDDDDETTRARDADARASLEAAAEGDLVVLRARAKREEGEEEEEEEEEVDR